MKSMFIQIGEGQIAWLISSLSNFILQLKESINSPIQLWTEGKVPLSEVNKLVTFYNEIVLFRNNLILASIFLCQTSESKIS
jgi:hypothetical protein